MTQGRSSVQQARIRLQRWEQKHERLLSGPATGIALGNPVVRQSTQELADRLESARLRFEMLRRADANEMEEAEREFERALVDLQLAWDAAVTRIGSTRA